MNQFVSCLISHSVYPYLVRKCQISTVSLVILVVMKSDVRLYVFLYTSIRKHAKGCDFIPFYPVLCHSLCHMLHSAAVLKVIFQVIMCELGQWRCFSTWWPENVWNLDWNDSNAVILEKSQGHVTYIQSVVKISVTLTSCDITFSVWHRWPFCSIWRRQRRSV